MSINIVVLSGAGMSAESGINTFRDANGLWEGHNITEVASPKGWQFNPALVLDFYNKRRQEVLQAKPNLAHMALVDLQGYFDVSIITQNVDDLHERAGSQQVLHLHGELLKSQSTKDPELIYSCYQDLSLGDYCELGSQLRPFIVWFGESVPELDNAISKVLVADIIIIVGTSMQVYPAAGLVSFAKNNIPIYYVDPQPSINEALACAENVEVIRATATLGLPELVTELIRQYHRQG